MHVRTYIVLAAHRAPFLRHGALWFRKKSFVSRGKTQFLSPLKMNSQPSMEMIEFVRDIPIYQQSIATDYFPILEKQEIARDFPNNWMTPSLAEALQTGKAEFVLSTGTNHARMQLIRPPYFLLHSYYKLWSEHPDIAFTWQKNCQRLSLTTVLATEHVKKINLCKHDTLSLGEHTIRRLDARTLYLNQSLDPALWSRAELERMLDEMSVIQQAHPEGLYHLDCSANYLAHLVCKVAQWGLENRFPRPASIIHAYESTSYNVRQFLQQHFNCPLIDLFGSTELGYIYYNDSQGNYQPYLDQMHLELVPLVSKNGIFSLIVSSLRNPYMPLIRYRTGDCVLTADNSPDPMKIVQFCGREKEMLTTVQGLIAQSDIDAIVHAVSPRIFIYQLCLVGRDHAELRYTTFDTIPLMHQEQDSLQHQLSEITGRSCSIIHRVHIPIGKSGKYAWLLQDENIQSGQYNHA